jgi:transcriptional regulator with GAF, ATPase, and Fis domain
MRRDAGVEPAPAVAGDLAQAIAELAAGIGRATLAQLLVQAQRLTQRHLAQAALARCNGNAAAAAALLGTTPAELVSMRADTTDSSATA